MNEQIGKIGIIHEDGETFLAPARKVSKITSIKKWDTAFRVYATIYSEANPHRASEIFQYIDVIHTLSSANTWESVMYYDFTFRQLMASKPWRSWAKTYTQGWNLAFNSNFSANKVGNNFNRNSGNGNGNGNGRGSRPVSKDWRRLLLEV